MSWHTFSAFKMCSWQNSIFSSENSVLPPVVAIALFVCWTWWRGQFTTSFLKHKYWMLFSSHDFYFVFWNSGTVIVKTSGFLRKRVSVTHLKRRYEETPHYKVAHMSALSRPKAHNQSNTCTSSNPTKCWQLHPELSPSHLKASKYKLIATQHKETPQCRRFPRTLNLYSAPKNPLFWLKNICFSRGTLRM